MAIKFQDSLEVKGGSASKIYLEGAGGTGSSTILEAYNPDDGAGHAGGTAYLKSSGWGEAQLAVGSYRWTQAGGKMTVTGGVYYFNTGNVGIGTGSPDTTLEVSASTTNLLTITNELNGQGAALVFNDNPTGTQKVYLTGRHTDGQSHGGGASLHLTSSEPNVTMVSERYHSIQHGDSSQWKAAYDWGDHSSVGYLTSIPSEYLTETEGDARYVSSSGGRITKNAVAEGASAYHLELYSTDMGAPENQIGIRFHQGGVYWGQLRFNSEGFRFTEGSTNNLVPVHGRFIGDLTGTADSANAVAWDNVTGKPTEFTPSAHNHAAEDITSGTLDADRLPWQTNDDFGGTYPIVWKATGSGEPYTSSWLNVNGTTDTLHARNIHADGKITSTGPITVNNRTAISVAHWSRSNNSTGAIKIKLPGLHNSNNWSMVVLRITTYEYNSNEHTIYYVSGHDWTSGWYNKKVTIIGESDKSVSVTYSESANEDYVIIGDPASTWTYGHVTVDVMAHPSFYSSSMDISTGWTIEQIEDLGDIELQPVETKRVANEQWVIDQGYLTSYTETDTLDSVLGRGSTTSRRADFLASESIRLKGARGQFANEYIHLYNKVGVGHPSGWGQGEGDTPNRGLSTYGAINVAYGASATSYFNGNISFTGNSRKIYLTGGDTNSQNGWIVGEQDRYGFGATWDSGLSILFQGWDGRNVTDTHNKDLGSVNIRDRVWNFLGSARLNNNDLATEAWVEEQPPAPAAASCAVVGDTIEVSFDPAPESPDYYQVWASQDGGSYSLIAQIPTQDFSPFMTVVDTAFSVSGLRAYRVYAVRRGIYSDPATTSRTYTQAALEPVNMNVVPMEESFFVQWDAPASRFVDHYEVYLDTHADQGSLNRNNANLVYSGNNTFYMHPTSTNEFHQFWVEIAES